MVTTEEGWGSKGVEGVEGTNFRCKIGYKDVVYNMGNIGNILNNCKWIVTFKIVLKT